MAVFLAMVFAMMAIGGIFRLLKEVKNIKNFAEAASKFGEFLLYVFLVFVGFFMLRTENSISSNHFYVKAKVTGYCGRGRAEYSYTAHGKFYTGCTSLQHAFNDNHTISIGRELLVKVAGEDPGYSRVEEVFNESEHYLYLQGN